MKRMVHFVPAIIVIVLAFAGCASSGGAAPAAAEPAAPIEHQGIVYATPDGVELKLDLVAPGEAKGPFPALVFIFGGGFQMGTRDQWSMVLPVAAQRGYVGVAIDHRLTDVMVEGKAKYPFPSQVHDVKCAVRWLRANAAKYRIDAARIGVVGFSSGGNLALMLGLTEPSDGLEGDCGDLSLSSSVQAVVNLAGPGDMSLAHTLYGTYIRRLMGGSPEEVPDRYKAASPITYLGGIDDAPVLTVCGSDDENLPGAKLLDERMRQAGKDHTLVIIEGAKHDLMAVNWFKDNPGWTFLDKHLKVGR